MPPGNGEHTAEACPYAPKPRTPRLVWQGMEERQEVEAAPTQVVEIVTPSLAEPQANMGLEIREESAVYGRPEERPNRLIWCNDNLVALQTLIVEGYEGKVDLGYIHPPFAVGQVFKCEIPIENGVSDEKAPSLIEEIAYKDTWARGLDSYLCAVRDRLEMLYRLLSPRGSLYVHLDWHAAHYVKLVLDEIFGYDKFHNHIAWRRQTSSGFKGKLTIGNNHDDILLYSKSSDFVYNPQYVEYAEEYVEKRFHHDSDGRRFKDAFLGTATAAARVERLKKEDRTYYTKTGGMRLKVYLDEAPGIPIDDIWTDLPTVNSQASEHVGFPTQKPVTLLERIISASSNPGDLVLDCFAGSGTTAAAAETSWAARDHLR